MIAAKQISNKTKAQIKLALKRIDSTHEGLINVNIFLD